MTLDIIASRRTLRINLGQSGAFQLSAGALPLTKVKGLGWMSWDPGQLGEKNAGISWDSPLGTGLKVE